MGINEIWRGNRKFFIYFKIEFLSKEKIIEELDQLVHQYNNLHLKIRENNEKIKRKLDKVIVKNILKAEKYLRKKLKMTKCLKLF